MNVKLPKGIVKKQNKAYGVVLTARVEQNVAEWLKLCAKEYNLTTSEFINQILTLSYKKNNK